VPGQIKSQIPLPCGRDCRSPISNTRIDPRAALSYVSDMTILPIITIPDPILRKLSEPVERVDAGVLKLMDDMLETMYAAPGIGLAAIQVNVPRRIVVLDVADEGEEKKPLCLINPEIIALGQATRLYEEGCLSIPDVRVEIERPETVTVRYIDRAGKQQEIAADGLLAIALQHELDHLDGHLIIDFLSRLKRDIIIRKFKKQARE
jgi:peptide deformylase